MRSLRVPRPSAWEVANVLSAVGSRVGGKLLSVAFIVVLARISTPTEFASYSYLVALALLFVILTDAGMAAAAGRDIARGDISLASAYREGIVGAAMSGLLGASAVAVFGLLDSGPGSGGAALAFTALFVAINAIFNYQASILRSSGRHWVESTMQIAGGALFVGCGVAVVFAGWGVDALMAAFALKELTMVCLAQAFLPNPLHAPRVLGAWRGLLMAGVVMSVATMLFAVTMRMSQIVLGNVGSIEEMALFSVAYRFLEASGVACAAIGVGLGPLLCARFASDDVRARRAVTKSLILSTGAALIVTPLAVVVTPGIVSMAFGERYAAAGSTAQIFVASTPLLLILFISWFALLAERRERIAAGAAAGGALVAGLGALLVVDQKDATSAAISAVLGLSTMTLICVIGVVRRRPTPSFPLAPTSPAPRRSVDLVRGSSE